MIDRFYYNFDTLLAEAGTQQNWARLFTDFNVDFTPTTELNNLFASITKKYYYDFIVYIDIEHPGYEFVDRPTRAQLITNYKKEVRKFLLKIADYLEESAKKYKTIINLYTQQEAHLLDKVESVGSTRYNDTPQTTTSIDLDTYATTYTKTTSATDLNTTMARLREVRINWENIYSDWEREFKNKFILEIV